MDYSPFLVTFKLAILTTSLLFLVAIPISYFLAFSKWKGKIILESLLMMPMILPPTVLGFYYISFLGPESTVGSFFEKTFGISFAFSFEGILLGSMIYCMPFMINPIINGYRSIPKNIIESTYLLKKSRMNALWYVLLPNIKRSIWSAILLTFAHTIGEFGIVLMIGGKVQGTNVASIAIYDQMNNLNYDVANTYALILLLISFVMILVLKILTRKNQSELA
jgi:molybdate transport system permease protein